MALFLRCSIVTFWPAEQALEKRLCQAVYHRDRRQASGGRNQEPSDLYLWARQGKGGIPRDLPDAFVMSRCLIPAWISPSQAAGRTERGDTQEMLSLAFS